MRKCIFNYNKETGQSRLTAYQLPKLELDETGHAYYNVPPHPYYYNQPLYWQKACYRGSQLPLTELIERANVPFGENPYISNGDNVPNASVIIDVGNSTHQSLPRMLNF